jgi:HAD superfamily hydrolase (TIGR01509 family)
MTKIKLIIFDLDGVLVDSRPLHYYALNDALEEIDKKYVISHDEHIAKYDGLSTNKKLELLNKEKNLSPSLFKQVWEKKQEHTLNRINSDIKPDIRLQNLLKTLKEKKYLLYCASNSIWSTVKIMLLRLGIIEYFDWFLSNEEVKNPKPSPEIYLKCMERAAVSPYEVLILEDSPIGRKSGYDSGANLCPIIDPADVTLDKIYNYIDMAETREKIIDLRWKKKINIIIPMAGYGSRFANAGYAFPKPLIDINGKPMIQLVVENLHIDGQYIFIVQKEHREKYSLDLLLNNIAPNCKIVQVGEVTEGAACTVLLAKEFIDNSTPLLIANSDQYLEWDSNEFLYCSSGDNIDGCISTFHNTHPKWSYAKLDDNGFVTEVQEKKPISTMATTGIYYWSKGSDYVKYAESMIKKNIRVNNEFYVCPVYNEAILDGKKIKVKDCKKMWGIGTPEDLTYFLGNYKP